MTKLEELKQEYPDLVKEYSEMTQEQLIEQICAEVLDLFAMEKRVQVFMNECTNNMSKTNYTIGSIKSLINEKQEKDIIDFCKDEVEDNVTDKAIAKSIRERANFQ